MDLGMPDWGDIGLLALGLAALVAAVPLAGALVQLRAAARAWAQVAAGVQEVLPAFGESARQVGEAAAGVRETARAVSGAAEAVAGAAGAVAGAADGVRARAEQLALTVDAVTGAASSARKSADTLRLALGVLEKTALPLLIRLVGWRAGLTEGIAYLLRGRRKKGG